MTLAHVLALIVGCDKVKIFRGSNGVYIGRCADVPKEFYGEPVAYITGSSEPLAICIELK